MFSTRMNSQFRDALTLDAVRNFAPSAFAREAHESRSARYAYIPTVEVIEGLMREGFAPFKACQSKSRVAGKQDFTKHMIRFRHPDAAMVNGVYPEVILVNSHDGSSAYKIIAGLFRMVCTNGLISGDKTGELAVHHKGNIVHQVIEGSFEIIGQSRKALAVTDDWSRLQLTAGEQHAFAAAAHELRFADSDGKTNTPITPGQLLAPRRSVDAGFLNGRAGMPKPDLWHTMNVVQENVIKGGLSAREKPGFDAIRARQTRGRMVTTRQVKGIDQDVKLNRALWVLAEKMQELKGGLPVIRDERGTLVGTTLS